MPLLLMGCLGRDSGGWGVSGVCENQPRIVAANQRGIELARKAHISLSQRNRGPETVDQESISGLANMQAWCPRCTDSTSSTEALGVEVNHDSFEDATSPTGHGAGRRGQAVQYALFSERKEGLKSLTYL